MLLSPFQRQKKVSVCETNTQKFLKKYIMKMLYSRCSHIHILTFKELELNCLHYNRATILFNIRSWNKNSSIKNKLIILELGKSEVPYFPKQCSLLPMLLITFQILTLRPHCRRHHILESYNTIKSSLYESGSSSILMRVQATERYYISYQRGEQLSSVIPCELQS